MEVVGAVASIAQLINITAKTIKYLNSVKDASEDRSRLLQETTSLLPLFLSLQGKVEAAQNHQSVEWLRHVRGLAVENGPLDQLRSALEHLAKRLKPKHGLKGVAYAFVWTLHKDESEALLARIERVKSTIDLALHGDTFALAQSIKADTDETRQDISTLTRDVASIQIREDLQQRQGILQWLSPLNFFRTQQDTLARRKEGTGQWLIDSPEFKNWLAGTSSILCCPGIPGAGKSVLASVVIGFLRERHMGQDSIGVAGVYCNFKERDSQSPENLLAACCTQLAPQTLPETMIDLHRTHSARNTRPNRQEIFKVFESCITQLRTAYLVVDAMDECSEDVRNILTEYFRILPDRIRLLVTTRHIDEILSEFRDSPRVEIRANPDDLKKFIASEIERKSPVVSTVRDRASLLQDICDKVTTKADGMFLAAKLHVDSLSTKTNIKKLKSALENLSTNLNVLYDEAILRIEKQPPDYHVLAEKALRWVAYTYRPLRVEALREALAIELDELDFDVEAKDPIGLILDVCAGLLVFDGENKMVRLVHYTTQDYFDRLAGSKFDDPHVLIAKECLVYLNYGIFQKNQISADDKQYLFHLFHYATTFWAQHAMTKRDPTLGLLEVHQFLAHHPRVHLQSPSVYDREPDASYPSFLKYHWDTMVNRHGCEIAAFYGLNDELEMFCEEIEGSQAPTNYLNSSLHLAVSNGQYRATEIVLDHGAVINTFRRGVTALHEAASLGHLDLVKLLLARGADVDARERNGDTPLLRAGEYPWEDCTIALINSGADIHIKDGFGRTTLHFACRSGLLNIVNILLARNMDADERDVEDKTPLFHAVENSHTDCILALLDHGANLDIQDHSGFTVLHEAASHGNFNAVNILLARGAKTEVRDNWGRTPLFEAVKDCHNDCIMALIDSGADVNVQDDDGLTPLHLASALDSIEIMVELLKHDAVVDKWSGSMYSVKFKKRWDPGLTPQLDFNLDDGCQINVCSAIQFTGSWYLERLFRNWEGVLEMLFWKDGLTALDIAVLHEHKEMIRTLKPLIPSTSELLTVSVEAFLLEQLGVASIEEAEELDRIIDAEEEAEDEDETED